MSNYQGLTVRHHDRHELDLKAELVIDPAHVEQVRFTATHAAVVNAATIQVRVRDVSRGGVGVESPIYLPRMTKATVRLFLDDPLQAGNAGTPLQRTVRICRCAMINESPAYLLGTQFIAQDGETEADLERLLILAHGPHRTGEEAA
jgi:PilZ domain